LRPLTFIIAAPGKPQLKKSVGGNKTAAACTLEETLSTGSLASVFILSSAVAIARERCPPAEPPSIPI
jgi:hypothetical protein